MDERKKLWLTSLVLLALGVACGVAFALGGCTSVLLMMGAAVGVVGAFMAFAVSFAA
jgi:hypothetical protein